MAFLNRSDVDTAADKSRHHPRPFSRRAALFAVGAPAIVTATCRSTSAATAMPDKELLDGAIESLRRAMLNGNGDVLKTLLHDQLQYMHSSGLVQTKADILAALTGTKFFAAFDYAARVAEIVDGVGVAMLTIDQTKNLPGGKTRASRIKVQQIWVIDEGRWKLLARSSAIIVPQER